MRTLMISAVAAALLATSASEPVDGESEIELSETASLLPTELWNVVPGWMYNASVWMPQPIMMSRADASNPGVNLVTFDNETNTFTVAASGFYMFTVTQGGGGGGDSGCASASEVPQSSLGVFANNKTWFPTASADYCSGVSVTNVARWKAGTIFAVAWRAAVTPFTFPLASAYRFALILQKIA